MKKWLSYTIDAVLVAIILLLGYTQISMMSTRKSNYGVPKAFGVSFLYIATDSMEVKDDPKSLGVGTGIIISNIKDINSLKASTPIFEKDEDGNEIYYKIDDKGEFILEDGNKIVTTSEDTSKRRVVDYELDGDVVTFYDEHIKAPNTHRLIDVWVDSESNKINLKTMGDNPSIHSRFKAYPETTSENIVQTWSSDYLIGKVTSHSKALGEMLVISSPAIAHTAFDKDGKPRRAWLFPVVILASTVGVIVYSMAKVFIKNHKLEKERDAKINEAMIAAGIDLNNEEACELFRMKEEIRLDYKEIMEEERKKIEASIERQKAKAKKQVQKELKKKGYDIK